MTDEKKYLFILGAMDPEMRFIERVLDEAMMPHVHATKVGRPVEPGTAYDATDLPSPTLLNVCDGVCLVECGGNVFLHLWARFGSDRVEIVDHHRPGDPGYGKPPDQFFEASSIGQVLRLIGRLGAQPPVKISAAELLMVAAADHCLRAAYSGYCPGVDPAALLEWRQRQRVSYHRGTVEELERLVKLAMWHLLNEAHPRICLNGEMVVDLRAVGTVPELPEAGVRAGLAYLVELDGKPGERKVVLQASDGRAVEAFLGGWAAVQGYERLYGDPVRGMCGGYRRV